MFTAQYTGIMQHKKKNYYIYVVHILDDLPITYFKFNSTLLCKSFIIMSLTLIMI